ncbi:hypothetical protein TNCV_4136611 [Trichonephila clavipes]|nr:hypothetical protein TNCV_4136611 [Trichonephila clavipes]
MNETTQLNRRKQLNSAARTKQLNSAARTKQLNSAARTKQLNSAAGTKQLNSAAGTKQLKLRNETSRRPPTTAYSHRRPPTTAYDRRRPPTTACNRLHRLYSRIGFFYLLPWFKITWSVAKSPRVAKQCDVNNKSNQSIQFMP